VLQLATLSAIGKDRHTLQHPWMPAWSRSLRPPRPAIHCRQSVSADAGFVLPLAVTVSLLLLLSSLSLQAMALQGQFRLAAEQRLRRSEDSLVSAAHHLVARLQRDHACLLPATLDRWASADCVAPPDLQPLSEGETPEGRWRLLSWQAASSPMDGSGRKVMELLLELSSPAADTSLRAAFAVTLAGEPLVVSDLRLLGWRGRV